MFGRLRMSTFCLESYATKSQIISFMQFLMLFLTTLTARWSDVIFMFKVADLCWRDETRRFANATTPISTPPASLSYAEFYAASFGPGREAGRCVVVKFESLQTPDFRRIAFATILPPTGTWAKHPTTPQICRIWLRIWCTLFHVSSTTGWCFVNGRIRLNRVTFFTEGRIP